MCLVPLKPLPLGAQIHITKTGTNILLNVLEQAASSIEIYSYRFAIYKCEAFALNVQFLCAINKSAKQCSLECVLIKTLITKLMDYEFLCFLFRGVS